MKKLRLYLNKNLDGAILKTNNAGGIRGNKASVPDSFWSGN